MGNTANYNVSPGIAFYNMAVANLHSSQNLIANNVCNFNSRGVHLNALSTDRSTSDNVIFNNTCNNNTDVGVGGIYNATTSQNNYIALNSIQNNKNGPFYGARDYVSNTDWNLLFPANISSVNTLKAATFSAKVVGAVSTSNTLQIEVFGSDSPVAIVLMDLKGNQIGTLKAKNGNNQLDVGPIASGMYILQLRNQESTLTFKTLKI
ncbi:MAG: T9SS type A sorting domain-containing protein [Bacteroidia bacterium]|nr:T9SS type A sorting domain-containing protein [Bacteroidia bacterium]